jgi:hypothetical protein
VEVSQGNSIQIIMLIKKRKNIKSITELSLRKLENEKSSLRLIQAEVKEQKLEQKSTESKIGQ